MVFRATDGVVGVLGVVHGDGGDAARGSVEVLVF